MFLLSIYETPNGRMVVACDKGLLGEEYREDETVLTVDEEFYDGKEATLDEVVAALKHFTTANLVGNELLDGLADEGVVAPDEVRMVDGVSHLQLFTV